LAAPEITLAPTNPLMTMPDLNPEIKRLPPVEKPESSAKQTTDSEHQKKESEKSAPQDVQNSKTNQLLEQLGGRNAELSFNVDKTSKRIIIKVINSQTKEVIRQIPPEELVRLAEQMQNSNGALVDQTV